MPDQASAPTAQFPPEIERWYQDSWRRSAERAQLHLRWVQTLDNLTVAIFNGERWPHVSLFWIKLHGLITELVEEQGRLQESLAQYSDAHQAAIESLPTQGKASARAMLDCARRIYERTCSVRDALTPSERVLLDYMRQCQAHPTPNSFGLQLTKKGVKETRLTAGEPFTVAELDTMLAAERNRYPDEAAAARAFALKLRDKIRVLRDAYEELA